MKNKKIKIFLGGYINVTNAQNLNCLSLAKYLDQNKFEIYTMTLYSGNIKIKKRKNWQVFKINYPFQINRIFAYIWGIFNCDIAYLPKREMPYFEKFLLKLFSKKSFTTIESNYNKNRVLEYLPYFYKNSLKYFYFSFKYVDKRYSITKFIRFYNEKHMNIKTEDEILYLGVEFDKFYNPNKDIKTLKNVIFIGSLLERKGILEFLDLAKELPNINFHIVGTGQLKDYVNKETKKRNNLIYHGVLTHHELSKLLKMMDLHILPSKIEGFPKVVLETAAAGVPSLVYDLYGADEIIANNRNGFIVSNYEELKNKVKYLRDNNEFLQQCSINAVILAKQFDWRNIIKKWEKEIERIINE